MLVDKYYENKVVLVTAGPTYEAIDPVRFIGNRSTGKMGIAIVDLLSSCGAKVFLVSGPMSVVPRFPVEEWIKVESAEEMFEACDRLFEQVDIGIFAAAVADYTPVDVKDQKIKKSEETWSITLKKTRDILKEMGYRKAEHQCLVGFALETENEMENALHKLKAKNLDMIVLNSMQTQGAGFGHDTNEITILDKHNFVRKFELKTKEAVASDILEHLTRFLPE